MTAPLLDPDKIANAILCSLPLNPHGQWIYLAERNSNVGVLVLTIVREICREVEAVLAPTSQARLLLGDMSADMTDAEVAEHMMLWWGEKAR